MSKLTGNAVLKVRGELKFSGTVEDALREYETIEAREKACATLLTEGKSYFGQQQIDALLE